MTTTTGDKTDINFTKEGFQLVVHGRRRLTLLKVSEGLRLEMSICTINCEWPGDVLRVAARKGAHQDGASISADVAFPVADADPSQLEAELKGMKFSSDAAYFQGTLVNGMTVCIVLE